MNPLSLDPKTIKVTIHIDDEDLAKPRDCSWSRVKELGTAFFTQSYHFLSLIRSGGSVARMQNAVAHQQSLLLRMDFPLLTKTPTFYFANHPSVAKALFRSHRDGDFFLTDNTSKTSIFQLLNDLMQDPTLTPEDLIFTCSPEKTKAYRRILQSLLSKENVDGYRLVIKQAVSEAIGEWANRRFAFNLNAEAHRITCRLLGLIFFGYNDTQDRLAEHMKVFFDYISDRFLNKPIHQEKVDQARTDFWQIVDMGIQQEMGLAWLLKSQYHLTDQQIRWLIFSLLFAGTDSTSGSVAYALLKVAQSDQASQPLKQEFLKNAKRDSPLPSFEVSCNSHTIKEWLAEGLRVFTPVIGVTRIAKEDLKMQITREGEPFTTFHIPKGSLLFPSQNVIARCPVLFPEEPHEFNARHQEHVTQLSSLPWMPFGGGSHPCPGAYLYQTMAQILVGEVVSQGRLITLLKTEPIQTGHFINKLSESIMVDFVDR